MRRSSLIFSCWPLILILLTVPVVGVFAEPLYPQESELEKANRLFLQANNLFQQRRVAEAIPIIESVLSIYEKNLGPDHPLVANSLNNMALLYYFLGDYAQAEPLYRRSLIISEKAYSPDHALVATTLNNLAELYRKFGNYAQAGPLLKRSLTISEKAYGPEHPDVALRLSSVAVLY